MKQSLARLGALALALTCAIVAMMWSGATPSVAAVSAGDAVYVGGEEQGYGGTRIYGIHLDEPADPGDADAPDFWAYCIEHNVSAVTGVDGMIGDFSDYLGNNYVADSTVQAKLRWILANSYPAMSLSEFGTAAGVPGISANDAVEATQYAIWRFTDLTFDASWSWETADSEDAYWYLVNGANASGGLPAMSDTITVTIDGPGSVTAGTIAGPYVLQTSEPSASLSSDPSVSFVDEDGDAIDASAVADGQEFYIDLRAVTAAGASTITATVSGASGTGHIVSVPVQSGDTPTVGEHAQTLILVAGDRATTSDNIDVSWVAATTDDDAGDTTGTDQSDTDQDDASAPDSTNDAKSADTLPDAGSSLSPWLLGSALASVLMGALLIAGGLPRSIPGRHRA